MNGTRQVLTPHTEPLLVLADSICTESGDEEFRRQVERTLAEARSIDGCLHAVVWSRPNRRYRFSTLWRDREAVTRWVESEFHRQVLMPGLREWCSEGWFEMFRLDDDHARAKPCAVCGGWTKEQPGWSEIEPASCRFCGTPMPSPRAEASWRALAGRNTVPARSEQARATKDVRL